MSSLARTLFDDRLVALAEYGYVPDAVIRWTIRQALASRVSSLGESDTEVRRHEAFVESLSSSPIALVPDLANKQHYEVPPAFFARVLGSHLKYSAGLFESPQSVLDDAESAMLELTARRAGIADGMRVLDLGCGWGSFSLYAAERFPGSEFTAVSNSKPQAEWIRQLCDKRGIDNLRVVSADMNTYDPGQRFDRVVSIEMFEHMRNWPALLERISQWLEPDGRLFLHFFCHRTTSYPYETKGKVDWMGRHFFSGGMMPGFDLIMNFQDHLEVEDRWTVEGEHYRRTSESWLRNLDARREEILLVLASTYGDHEARRWYGRWRIFFLACAELFGFGGGSEWFVSHVRLAPRRNSR